MTITDDRTVMSATTPPVGLAAAVATAAGLPVHDLYSEQGAALYDRLVHASAELAPALAAVRAAPAGLPVLDIACGSGRVGLQLARRGRAVVGLDASDAMLARYRRRLDAEPAEVAARTTLERGDFHRLAERFAPGSFAAAVLGATTVVLVDPALRGDMFAAVHALLAPGGVFLLDVPGLDPAELRARPERTTVFEPAAGGNGVEWTICVQHFDLVHRRESVSFLVDGVEPGARQVVTTSKRIVFPAEVAGDLRRAGFAVDDLRAGAGAHWLRATRNDEDAP